MLCEVVPDRNGILISANLSVQCPEGKYKVLNMTNHLDYMLTTEEKLMSVNGMFEPSHTFSEFCIDLVRLHHECKYSIAVKYYILSSVVEVEGRTFTKQNRIA